MKQKIEALTLAFNKGVDYGRQISGNPHIVKARLKEAIEGGLAVMSSQPGVRAEVWGCACGKKNQNAYPGMICECGRIHSAQL